MIEADIPKIVRQRVKAGAIIVRTRKRKDFSLCPANLARVPSTIAISAAKIASQKIAGTLEKEARDQREAFDAGEARPATTPAMRWRARLSRIQRSGDTRSTASRRRGSQSIKLPQGLGVGLLVAEQPKTAVATTL